MEQMTARRRADPEARTKGSGSFTHAELARVIVLSHRLPFELSTDARGFTRAQPSSGGLVRALFPFLKKQGGVWVGWPGAIEDEHLLAQYITQVANNSGFALEPVFIGSTLHKSFYQGFSNKIIWPLFHDMPGRCDFFHPHVWESYLNANERFAEATIKVMRKRDFIWVHDYQLISVASALRKKGANNAMGFFLHIPFPAAEIFAKLPWREEILQDLLEYNLIGVQTELDAHNLVEAFHRYLPQARCRRIGKMTRADQNGRSTQIGVFPIGIDFSDFDADARRPEIEKRTSQLRAHLPTDRKILLGIDRLDYTKGILHRLHAFRLALRNYSHLRGAITFIQVTVPSRETIDEYENLKENIEKLVSEINGEFSQPGNWIPVHYVFRHLSHDDLIAYYRASDIAIVTSLNDGMNLVAKEYCAANIDESGVLILSEFAGAAEHLRKGALLVNPCNIRGVAQAIETACVMPIAERQQRMRALRRQIRQENVYRWADRFLSTAARLNSKTAISDPAVPASAGKLVVYQAKASAH